MSLGARKAGNTFATNYFMRDCRTNYLYEKTLGIKMDSETNEVLSNSIKLYNNSNKIVLNGATPYDVFRNEKFNKVALVLSEKSLAMHSDAQIYNEYIKRSHNKSDFLEKLPVLEDTPVILKGLVGSYLQKAPKYNVIPNRKRDIITKEEFKYIINLNEYKLLNSSGDIRSTGIKTSLQIKILLILLYLSGCRVSELTRLTFRDMALIIKEAILKL